MRLVANMRRRGIPDRLSFLPLLQKFPKNSARDVWYKRKMRCSDRFSPQEVGRRRQQTENSCFIVIDGSD
jgi:hypothetical protein